MTQSVIRRVRPQLSAGAYAIGDSMGGMIDLGEVFRNASMSGVLQSLTLHQAETQAPNAMELLLFNAPLETGGQPGDNGLFELVAADEPKLLGRVDIAATEWVQYNGGCWSACIKGIGLVVAGTSARLYAVVVARGTTSGYSNTVPLTIKFGFLLD